MLTTFFKLSFPGDSGWKVTRFQTDSTSKKFSSPFDFVSCSRLGSLFFLYSQSVNRLIPFKNYSFNDAWWIIEGLQAVMWMLFMLPLCLGFVNKHLSVHWLRFRFLLQVRCICHSRNDIRRSPVILIVGPANFRQFECAGFSSESPVNDKFLSKPWQKNIKICLHFPKLLKCILKVHI